MTMRDHAGGARGDDHDLDRRLDELIDALNAGWTTPAPDDDDLAGLLRTARSLRRLSPGSPLPQANRDVPSRIAANLASELRRDRVGAADGRGAGGQEGGAPTLDNHSSNGANRRPPREWASELPERHSSWRRQALQFVASIVAFALVAAVLVAVLRDGGVDDGSVGDDGGGPEIGVRGGASWACYPLSPPATGRSAELAFITGENTKQAGSVNEVVLAMADGSSARTIAKQQGSDFSTAWSPDGSRIAFVSDVSGVPAVFVVEPDADGAEARKLTDENVPEQFVAWSPDGTSIAYARGVEDDADIFISSSDGSSRRQLTFASGADLAPRWSPDGGRIMFLHMDREGETTTTRVIEADGSGERDLEIDGVSTVSASWSPDGCSILVIGERVDDRMKRDVYTVNADGSNPRRLTDDGTMAYHASWSPSGAEILYARVDRVEAVADGTFEILRMNADGANQRLIHTTAHLKLMPPVWSPDGQQIAFAGYAYDRDRWVLQAMNADGTNLRVISDDLTRGAVNPAWRPATARSASQPANATGTASPIVVPPPVEAAATEPVDPATPAIPTPAPSATLAPDVVATPTIVATHPILMISPDYGACDDVVIARGANFEPSTTVAIYGGWLNGDSFQPVAEDVVVADDGTFEAPILLARLVSECGGGNAESEGTQYRIAAGTGSSASKSGSDPDGPYASAVFTFSRDVPLAVRDRDALPSCGAEIMLSETLLRAAGRPENVARKCFFHAWENGARAEFVSYQQTIEGDVVTRIYRLSGNGEIEIMTGGEQGSGGSGRWERSTCSEMSATETGDDIEFEFAACSDVNPIE